MIQKIRKSKASKIIACYLALMIVLEIIAPMQAFALTGGPSQPEFESFTPIGTSDMVDLSNGDFNYNIPIMDVGGYPLNLAYNSTVSMDQEASWVGLGWDLNAGQITRQMRGLPDDFDGDEMIYENHMKDNVTVGANFNVFATLFAISEKKKAATTPAPPPSGEGGSGDSPLSANIGQIGVKYNNYQGFVFTVSAGLTYQISDNLSVGMDVSSSASEGVDISPSVNLHSKFTDKLNEDNKQAIVGLNYNNRIGIDNYTMSASRSKKVEVTDKKGIKSEENQSHGTSGSISFVNSSFTPTKRVGMRSSNFVFNMNLEGEIWGVEPGMKFTGYVTTQGIKNGEENKIEKAYGFENTYNATDDDILDFNREKDRTFSRFSTTLPITNNTYDIYSIQGQGVSGMFRPYKGQVGYVYDNRIEDQTFGGSAGLELGAGGGAHWGADISVTTGNSYTKVWRNENPAIARFEEQRNGNRPDYEKVYFKNIGGFHVDSEQALLDSKLGGYDPIRFGIASENKFARKTELHFKNKNAEQIEIPTKIKREKRVARNQAIQKLTVDEAMKYGNNTEISKYSRNHHTAEIKVIKDGGERYVYGRAAYNTKKKEATFSVDGKMGDCRSGLVPYNPGIDNSDENNNGDKYFNRVTTPAYAHSYLLTSVLSSDYSDLTNDGPSDDDLGSYTKFEYDTKTNDNTYKWRVPYAKRRANYEEGLKSLKSDDKGNYIYGEKEILYIKKIETKTHIAIFDISLRKDGYGVDNEDGGGSTATSSKMYKLNKISLYSKPEYNALKENATPIKVAHFVYDYSLCKGVENNFKEAADGNVELSNDGGKLTLKKVYFTYRNSNMGKYTPYVFDYIKPYGESYDNNPNYDMKAYDIWGNYKPNPSNASCGIGMNDALPNTDFPYVQQFKDEADRIANSWLLQSVKLPSGGKIEMTYESDNYTHVQDKETMQMFQVAGVGRSSEPGVYSQTLYDGNAEADMLYVNIGGQMPVDFKNEYVRHLINEPIYFKFLLNMSKPGAGHDDRYDYVTGYLELKEATQYNYYMNGHDIIFAIPIKTVNKGDGFNSDENVNPIALAGWQFGREYLNRFIYQETPDESTDNIEEIVMEILGALPNMLSIMKSPNRQLMDRNIASKFVRGKSWIRLMCPKKTKLGGGSRVKEIKMYDEWDVMTDHANNEDYKQFYGQQYSYNLETGLSSGVATYEPLGGKENPLVQPFFDKTDHGKLLGPNTKNFVEKPLGESFYPSPKITYSRVKVKNLPREIKSGETVNSLVKKHATGEVVTEFYTSKDYPVIADYTDMLTRYDRPDPLSSLVKLYVKDHLALTQGYSIHTNDMDGKMKAQYVYGEGQDAPISTVKYHYDDVADQGASTYNPNKGKLDNSVITIDSNGKIDKKLVGVDYDVINDFRDSKTMTTTAGISVNTAFLPITLLTLIIPTPIPSLSIHENRIKTAVTTKVIHTSAILRGKTVTDGGASITTKNLAWDAETGEVLLTEVNNEFNDKYYSFNFPAYWTYKGMSQSAKNLGMRGELKRVYSTEGKYQFSSSNYNPIDYLNEGDELWVSSGGDAFKTYVSNVENGKFTLISEKGFLIKPEALESGEFTVIRSGYRNMQTSSMAAITSMVNPLYEGSNLRDYISDGVYTSASWNNYKIVNASAIEYSDTWAAQCECRLPKMKYDSAGKLIFDYSNTDANQMNAYNPFKYNVKGNWRPKVSYAYLTGRNTNSNASTRNAGFYNNFYPFYTYKLNDKKWVVNTEYLNKWRFASEVSQYNPFGFEVENKDALGRYSSAIYGYNYKFPVAVAANTRYKELAFDGFEDYDFNVCDSTSHFSYSGQIERNKVTVSSTQAHSGRKSLKVAPNNRAIVKKQIVPCNTTPNNP